MQQISITGANSFIGSHLIKLLTLHDNIQVTSLKRINSIGTETTNINHHVGDLLDSASLQNFAKESGTVIHLAYLHNTSAEDNLIAMLNLLDHCEKTGIKRFIHCSTAVVVGNTLVNNVTEKTICHPINEYEKIKLLLEKMLIEKAVGRFEYIIIRPTAIFGVGGKNLVKTFSDIKNGNSLQNYIKRCVHGKRNMHLVCIENVIGAIKFLIDSQSIANETFIISDDDSPINNYGDISNIITDLLKRDGLFFPTLPLPPFVLATLLRLTGKSDCNPYRVYNCNKLLQSGYQKTLNFEDAIINYVNNHLLIKN